jgi:hypothetical protein
MNIKTNWLLIAGLVIVVAKAQVANEAVSVSFDTLFAPTWYERAYTATMQLLAYHEKVQGMRDILPEQASKIIDICLAKLVYLQHSVAQMKLNESAVPKEDLQYLENLINQVKQALNDTVLFLSADDRTEIMKQLLNSIEENLGKF